MSDKELIQLLEADIPPGDMDALEQLLYELGFDGNELIRAAMSLRIPLVEKLARIVVAQNTVISTPNQDTQRNER